MKTAAAESGQVSLAWRRHLDQRQLGALATAASAGEASGPAEPHPQVEVLNLLNDGYNRYQTQKSERDLGPLPPHGAFEAAVVAEGDAPGGLPTRGFRNLISAANPDYTGWPLWIVSGREDGRDPGPSPHVRGGGWEAFLYEYAPDSWYNHLDFWRAEPAGRFYAYRAFEDDISEGPGYPESMTELDFGLVVWRVAEAIAVPMAFVRAMDFAPEETALHYAFRWSGLKGRELSSWSDRARRIPRKHVCHEPEVRSPVIYVPLETPTSALAPYVRAATADLFAAFDGFELSADAAEDLTRSALKL